MASWPTDQVNVRFLHEYDISAAWLPAHWLTFTDKDWRAQFVAHGLSRLTLIARSGRCLVDTALKLRRAPLAFENFLQCAPACLHEESIALRLV